MQTTQPRYVSRSHLPRILALAFGTAALLAAPALAQRTSVNVNVGIEIETRGPVHEAFAEPVVFDPDPGLVVPQAPPQELDEVPPAEQPEGPSVTWVPGYWSWDDDRNSFIWVSGIWRSIPPGRQFVPGYWAQVPGGYQWVPGFWLNSAYEAVDYLPAPPAPVSVDPVGPPPAADYTWVPGVWLWRDARYVWRPGYWLPPQQEWVWVPAHYVWTPSGYVFISGYWDYAVRRRGLLFAPVYVPRPVLARRVVYTPTVVIDSGILVDHLFARPRYRHYYFGDYYAAEYRRVGIVPVFDLHHSRHGYSPLYEHALAVHVRRDPGWEHRFAHEYDLRRDHPNDRPPRTWAAFQKARGEHPGDRGGPRGGDERSRTLPLARSLSELASSRDTRETPFRLERLAPDQRDDLHKRLTRIRDYQEERRKLELSAADKSPLRGKPDQGHETGADNTNGQSRVRTDQRVPRIQPGQRIEQGHQEQNVGRSLRLNLPRSPVVGRQTLNADKATTPPARPMAPKVDTTVRPRPNVQPGDRTPGSNTIRRDVNPKDNDKDKAKDKDKDKGKKAA